MIISVASGKGGTGKTLIATSLALSLKEDHKVQIIDCDVEEPNDHIFIKPAITRSEPVNALVPRVDQDKCNYCGECARVCAFNAIAVLGQNVLTFHELCHSCGACTYLCPQKAISEVQRQIGSIESGDARGLQFMHGKLSIGEAMAPPVIRKVKGKIKGDSVVIIDASPGTSCPVVEAVRDSDYCILVTEPTPFGLNDLVLAVEMIRTLKIPCGIVLNRVGVGDKKVEEYSRAENLPLLMSIPLDLEIARNYSKGITLIDAFPRWKSEFIGMYNRIGEIINERNSSLKR
jgi:MinD superfamily P-loop ATPase